jgi:V8-like Glu-specific endopeptidase
MRIIRSLIPLSLVLFLLNGGISATAIEGGKLAAGENVVTFVLRNTQTGKLSLPTCSGSLIAPRIVVTAKHCVVGFNSSITWLVNEKWEVTYPGADIQSAELKTAKILSIFANPGEFTTTDDIALVVIDREFPVSENLRVASSEDMVRLRSAQAPSVTYGYGSTATSNLQTFLPYKIENRLVQDFPDRSFGLEVFAIQYLQEGSYICGGDSGGPNYILSESFMYFIGPTGFATRPGCAKGLVGNFHSGGTAIAYKTNLIKDAESYLVRVKIEEAKQEAEAKAAAELKAKQDAELIAKVLAERQANSDAAQRAAAEMKAKEEAAAIAAADKAAFARKTTIICAKGKLTKKVTAVKPKCPAGYKVKR